MASHDSKAGKAAQTTAGNEGGGLPAAIIAQAEAAIFGNFGGGRQRPAGAGRASSYMDERARDGGGSGSGAPLRQ
jgi:hypothetical protein